MQCPFLPAIMLTPIQLPLMQTASPLKHRRVAKSYETRGSNSGGERRAQWPALGNNFGRSRQGLLKDLSPVESPGLVCSIHRSGLVGDGAPWTETI
jgi:hypothetical protein